MVITPPYAHIHWQSFVRHGLPWITLDALDPGIQEVVTGTQGWGVSTPNAAAVAADTAGFAMFVHIANGVMFAMGCASIIVATGLPSISTFCWLVTFSVDGAVPNGHINEAVAVT